MAKSNDIYVISFERDKDILGTFIELANKKNMNCEIFNAETPQLTDQLTYLLKNDLSRNGGLVCRVLGHFNLWRKIIHSDKGVFIFEDHTVIKETIKDFSEYWNDVSEHIPKDAGIIFLSHGKEIKMLPEANKYLTSMPSGERDVCEEIPCGYYITSKMAKIYNDYIIENGIYREIGGIMMDVFVKYYESKPYILLDPVCHKSEKIHHVNISKTLSTITYDKILNIHWENMWKGWNPQFNFFTQFIQNRFNIKVITDYSKKPNVIFSSVFGQYRTLSMSPMHHGAKKILYTGENVNIKNLNFDLSIGFTPEDDTDMKYIRFPLWLIMIDWYNVYNLELQGDPDGFPISWLERKNITYKRQKFCVFVCSDQKCWYRNKLAQIIHRYKKIDCGGRLFNNIQIPTDADSSQGRYNKKLDFFSQYKFALVAENENEIGYCTEKLVHGFAAGCIPIYWGDVSVIKDFNEKAFINCNGKSFDDVSKMIMEIDTNDDLYLKMRNEPVFVSNDVCDVYLQKLELKLKNVLF
jgi:GR25 family glycosyltransferase involved in LPS biosynthesis